MYIKQGGKKRLMYVYIETRRKRRPEELRCSKKKDINKLPHLLSRGDFVFCCEVYTVASFNYSRKKKRRRNPYTLPTLFCKIKSNNR